MSDKSFLMSDKSFRDVLYVKIYIFFSSITGRMITTIFTDPKKRALLDKWFNDMGMKDSYCDMIEKSGRQVKNEITKGYKR